MPGALEPKIAERFAIGARTAKFHVQNIVEKLGVADHKQANEHATKLGVLPDER